MFLNILQPLAVFLMDTMGTADKTYNKDAWTSLFILSTMIASVHIYNVKESVDLDHLEKLEV